MSGKPFEESSFVVVMVGEGVDDSLLIHGWEHVCRHLRDEEGFTLDELCIDDDAWTRRDQDSEKLECRTEFEIGWLRITRIFQDSAGTVYDATGLGPRELADKVDAGEKFKAFVHAYLDQHDVPHGDPTNQHQIEGCRIGARLDLLFAQLTALQKDAERWRKLLEHSVSFTGDVLVIGEEPGQLDGNRLTVFVDSLS